MSRLFHKGIDSGALIEGLLLQAQYECSAGYLLLLTDDCPFEELLHIHLLDRNLRPLDQVNLGKAYEAGILSRLQVTGNDVLEFSFFGGDRWQLSVLTEPRYHLSIYVGEWLVPHLPLHRPFRYAFRPNYLLVKCEWTL